MWAVDDVISLKLFQRHLDQEILNTLTYQIVTFGLSADIDTLLTTIESLVLPVFASLQSDTLNHWKIRFDNLTSQFDFAERLVDVDGELVGNTLPSYVAGGFIKVVGNKGTRAGSLRLGGMTEDFVANNVWSPNATTVAALEGFLAATVTNGLTGEFKIDIDPIVAKQISAGPPAVHIINPVLSVGAKTNISSQVSRKAGQGT